MFIDNVNASTDKDAKNDGAAQKLQQWEKEILLRLLENRTCWKLLVVNPGIGDELPIIAHMLGAKGEMVIVDTDPTVLDQIAINKQNRLYVTKSTKALTMNGPYKRYATVQANVHIHEFDGSLLDFADDYFDAMWCPIEQLSQSSPAYETLVNEFYRVVRPGGFVVLKQPVFQVA